MEVYTSFVLNSFYMSRYHFLQIFKASFSTEKKIFVASFLFLTDSLKPPRPLNGQNPLAWQKFFADAP